MIAAVSLATALATRGPTKDPAKPLTPIQRQELAIRKQAATWLAQQVSHSTRVACDQAMCAAIENEGFPKRDLTVLGQNSLPPEDSALVIQTAYVSTVLGTSFSANDAPMIIASFGKGTSRIDIRVIAPGGAAAYSSDLTKDLAARKIVGASLLASTDITVSHAARSQMTAGEVDMRPLVAILALAGVNPVDVVDFGNTASGASQGVPLRYVDLAENGKAARMSTRAYRTWMLKVLNGLNPPYHYLWTTTLRLPGGLDVLRVQFGAPTLLLLQAPSNP